MGVAEGFGNLRTANWRTGNMRTNMRTRPLIGRDVTRMPRAVRKVPHGVRSSHCFVSRPNEPSCSIQQSSCYTCYTEDSCRPAIIDSRQKQLSQIFFHTLSVQKI